MNKDVKQLVRRVRKAGWEVRLRTGCGHYLFVSPSGERVSCPATPSDRRSLLNVEAKMRRTGEWQ